MKRATEGLRLLRQAIQDALEEELDDFAEEWEEDTRNERDWQDDTGSAADAITAYQVGKGNPRKNFGGIAWETARSIGSQKYKNPPENYQPHVENIDVGEGSKRKVVVLTNFVPYALTLEFGSNTYPGGNLITMSTEGHRDPFVMHLVSAFSKALRKVTTG